MQKVSQTPTGQALAEIWAELLRRDHVGPDDDFFDLGGNSLLAVRMAALVHERLGVEAPLRRLVDCRTPAAFARCIDEAASGEAREEEQGVI